MHNRNSNAVFNFSGGCDLVLLSNPAFNRGQGLHVHVRTKITRWWSSIESAAVRIGDDILEVKAGIETRPYWINGEEGRFRTSKPFPFTLGGFHGRFRYRSDRIIQYKIFLPNDQNLVIKSIKNMLRVELQHATEEYFGQTLGLMGTYRNGLLVGRDGSSEFEDADAFGLEWQVTDKDPVLFREAEGPQYPDKCAMPQVDKSGVTVARRLAASTVTAQQAEKACAAVDRSERENCIFDVLAMDDLTAVEGY